MEDIYKVEEKIKEIPFRKMIIIERIRKCSSTMDFLHL